MRWAAFSMGWYYALISCLIIIIISYKHNQKVQVVRFQGSTAFIAKSVLQWHSLNEFGPLGLYITWSLQDELHDHFPQ